MNEFHTVIRGGLIVDGSGDEPFEADIGIANGKIVTVAPNLSSAAEEIDASGLMVMPGFVDVHTHYDGQATWENRLRPSSFHGVTTAIMGNCGVGFAPCRPDQRETLLRLMEGVEDIPFPVLDTGLPWTWETFPEYLSLLESRSYDLDIGCYVPHAALRVYVMGQRGADREPARPEDIARMCALLGEALDAGALGIGTSRTILHRSSDGSPIFTLEAGEAELFGLADTLRQRGKGVFQIVEDLHLPGADLGLVRRLAERAERPVTFSIGAPNQGAQHWPMLLDQLSAANKAGLCVKGQVLPRGIGVMLGHELTLNPFYSTPTYQKIAPLPLVQRVERLRDPKVRAAILGETGDPQSASMLGRMVRQFETMFQLGAPPDYEQPPESSIAARAARASLSPEELAYELMLQNEGREMLYLALANYVEGSLDTVGEILRHADIVPGLGDGGAHCGTICDGSYSTFMLMHWGRDRAKGRIPIEQIVQRLSRNPALLMGLEDRGLIASGCKADINIVDFDRLSLHAPEIAHDLPGGGRRLVQKAEGYRFTLVNGRIVYRDGEPTGALPGRLIRGAT